MCGRIVKTKKGDERRWAWYFLRLLMILHVDFVHIHLMCLPTMCRSHGALCACTSINMKGKLPRILHGGGTLSERTRIQCIVKSTFSETRLVPVLNDLLIANPSPAAVSRFRMGWSNPVVHGEVGGGIGGGLGLGGTSSISDPNNSQPRSNSNNSHYGTVTRVGGKLYDIQNSLNVWSSGMWVSTATGAS